jgi:hypothetical protein
MNKKLIIFSIFIYLLISCSSVKEPRVLPKSNEVECLESIQGNSYKYLAWGFGYNNAEAEEDALKAAVYAAMISGGAGNCTSLLDTEEISKSKDFIYEFFKKGVWYEFVINTNKGYINPNYRLKTESGEIKLGVEVIIKTKELREYLIQQKIIQKTIYGL